MTNILKSATVILAFMGTTSFFAQNTITPSGDTRENFKFGFKAGINIANVYDESNEDFVADSKTGFVGGAFLSIPISKYIGFQPEVLYSEKGFQAKGSTPLGNYEFKRTSTYLDIPLQLQIKPIEYVTILAGPQYSYLLETKNEFNGNSNTTQEEAINGDNYKKNIFGFVVGADFNIDNFIISARGGWDITQSDSDGNSDSPRYKNQVIQFTVGYAF